MWKLESQIERDGECWLAEGPFPLTHLVEAVTYAKELRGIYAKHGTTLRCRVVVAE